MSIADQVHDKISGLVMNQLAYRWGDDQPTEISDALYDVVSMKINPETEIPKLLGADHPMLGYGNLMALAEQITLQELFTQEAEDLGEVNDYIDKFPEAKAKWLAYIISLID